MLSNKFFKNNRIKLIKQLEENSCAIFNAKDPYIKGDSTYFSEIDTSLFYFSGITQEDTKLVITKEKNKSVVYLFITKPDLKKQLWEGKQLLVKEAKSISGINNIRFIEEFETVLDSIMQKTDTIYFPDYPHEKGKSSATIMFNKIKEKFQTKKFISLNQIVKDIRQIKEKEEINEIKKAINISKKGFLAVMGNLKEYKNEAEIEAELSFQFIKNHAKHSYHPIVAGGKNALTLHYIENKKNLKKNQLVLIDAGAQNNNYKSDITRTFPLSGKFNKRQKEVYSSVLKIQKYAMSYLKIGIERREYEIAIILKTAKELINLKLLKKEKIIPIIKKIENSTNKEEKQKYLKKLLKYTQQFYPHSTSHFLGLDTHDLGNYGTLIQENEVITVEPGIYIKKENIGIRIEDNVLITKKGCKNLSKSIPKEIKDIEKIIQ